MALTDDLTRRDRATAALDLDNASDTTLLASVASVVSEPRAQVADSFVLHAPLELAARAALLPFVATSARDTARRRIAEIAPSYEAFADPVAPPARLDFDSLETAAAHLADAISGGDLDTVDAVAAWLGEHGRPSRLRSLLAEPVVDRLAAAAHAPIFLYLLPRVAPRGELPGTLLRPLARELARHPDWKIEWCRAESDDHVAPPRPGDLFEALASTPHLGIPGSEFIYPLMHQVDRPDIATLLTPATSGHGSERPTEREYLSRCARELLRAAAASMLTEPPDHAPYGWSHCLTMTQAALGIAADCADATVAVRVAATFVAGFRAALARRPLVATFTPAAAPRGDLRAALHDGPGAAAATVWHAPPHSTGMIATALATHAATHHDAHLVKYTLACLDAAAWDRTAARLYLAAAAALGGWWAQPDHAAVD